MNSPLHNAAIMWALLAVAAGAQTAHEGKISLLRTIAFPITAISTAINSTPDDLAKAAPKPDLRSALRASASGTAQSPSLTNPDPLAHPVVKPEAAFFGYAGLTHYASRNASNGNQFSVEPPDQGLAVGNGFVFEAVNSVLAVYSKTGIQLTPAVALNAFLGLPPAIIRGTPNHFGPSTGDPRVYYDQQIQRWFLTTYEEDVDVNTGAPTGPTHVMLAVSTSSDPRGAYFVYSILTTDDGSGGTPSNPNCPCFPDQPLLGADANGLYISTNEFPLFTSGFNGTQIYATSKQALAAGTPGALVHFTSIPLAEGIAYSVQPALSLDFSSEPASGVEYFLSALDFFGTLDNRIAVWAVLNTSTLVNAHPNLQLVHKVLNSEVYGTPTVGAAQPPGPTPLGTSLGDSEEQLNPDDDRMQQTVYENGRLWAGLTTVVGSGTPTSLVRNGVAYFIVKPILIGSSLTGIIERQGYVAAPGTDSVIYPSIGVSPTGNAAMTFTLVGPTGSLASRLFYPSMAFTRVNLLTGTGPIQLGAAGAEPEDGFSGYPQYGGNGFARWGDYTWAIGDVDGSVWLAAEFIPNTARTSLANWGSFIGTLPSK
jgi:hypothetical protein